MSEPVAPAVPAQPPAPSPAPATAVQQAVVEKDFKAFESAKRAELQGKPIEAKPVEAAPVVAEPPADADAEPEKAAEPSKPISKRQERINEYERQIAALRAENARLKTPPPPAAPRSDQPPPVTTIADAIARPDLSKPPLTEPEFFKQFPDAGIGDLADYRAAYRYAHARADETRQTEAARLQATQAESRAKAQASMDTAMKDAAFVEKVTPLLSTLQTAEQVQADGQRPTAEHYFAGALTRSSVAAKLLEHLADHPEVLEAVRTINPYTESGAQELRATFYRLEGQYLSAPAPAPPAPVTPPVKHKSDAPKPPTTLGSKPAAPADPMKEAVATRNYTNFERLKREELRAAQSH